MHTVPVCNPYEQMNLLLAREKQTKRAEQLQHNGNFTEAMAAEINHNDLVCAFIEVSTVFFYFDINLTSQI